VSAAHLVGGWNSRCDLVLRLVFGLFLDLQHVALVWVSSAYLELLLAANCEAPWEGQRWAGELAFLAVRAVLSERKAALNELKAALNVPRVPKAALSELKAVLSGLKPLGQVRTLPDSQPSDSALEAVSGQEELAGLQPLQSPAGPKYFSKVEVGCHNCSPPDCWALPPLSQLALALISQAHSLNSNAAWAIRSNCHPQVF